MFSIVKAPVKVLDVSVLYDPQGTGDQLMGHHLEDPRNLIGEYLLTPDLD